LVKPTSVEQWIGAAQRGDVQAFEELYRRYVDRIYGVCLRMTGQPSDAEDCAQNAFVKAWRQIGRFEGRSDFGTWLHRIAVNEVLMAGRRRGDGGESVGGEEPVAQAVVSDDAAARDLEAAIGALPEQARHIFVLKAVYGYSHDEIAAFMGIAAGTARAHFHRARQLLMRELKLEDDDGPAARP
jgi:RNA polymerase sigma-70 factor (ECF subfamily)